MALSWSASSGATSYNILRSTNSGGSYTGIASGITLTSSSDTGLNHGTTYYYVVEAVNLGGTSANALRNSSSLAIPTSAISPSPTSSFSPQPIGLQPDNDDVPILLKYATAMTPGTPSAAGPATIGVTGNFLTLQFDRLSPAPVNYIVEASSDLVNWTAVANLPTGATTWTGTASVSETGANPVAVTVTDSVALSPSSPRFLRLRVTTATDVSVPGTVPQGDAPLDVAGSGHHG